MTDDFATFLRVLVGVVLAGVVIGLGVLATIGIEDVWATQPQLVCVKAHDEFHQTDNGTKVRLCDEWVRR